MIQLVFTVMLVLLVSAWASGTEASLFAVPLSKVETFIETKRRGSAQLKQVKQNIGTHIMTIVIINNIANIVGSIVVGGMAAYHFRDVAVGPLNGVGIFSAVLTFLVITFSEIVPKTLGERHADKVALLMAPLVLFLSKLSVPLIYILRLVTRPFVGQSEGLLTTSEAEIRALTEIGSRSGVIEEDEGELIRNVFELNDITAYDIMTPLAKVDALEADQSLDSLRDLIPQITHTRLPVHEGSFAQLVGVVHLRNILQALSEGRGDCTVRELTTPSVFIPSTAVGDDLLRHFKRTKQHLAIVVDAFGTVLGILTLEDVLEVLVGDIVDETDIEPEEIELLAENRVLVISEAEGEAVNNLIGTHLSELRIGEIVINALGRIPEIGEQFIIDDAEFTIRSGTPRAWTSAEIRLLSTEERIPEDDETEAV